MYFEPGNIPHGLPFNPFKSCIVPRPIGWISTTSIDGTDNLAPFSQFQMIGYDPPIVMFSANQNTRGSRKDSVVNTEARGEFVWNMATWALREEVNRSSEELDPGVDEFVHAGLAKLPSRLVKPPRVAASPVHFECRHLQTVHFQGNSPVGTVDVLFGQVIAVHIDDQFLGPDGKVDIVRIRPLARMGYHDYTSVEQVFTMTPRGSATRLAGLEGSPEKMAAALGTRTTRG
jgi:flavin reductase (DIM6/NTAB) family NADH-FMN oxidoreductase RutF